jgi:hypothetical protein
MDVRSIPGNALRMVFWKSGTMVREGGPILSFFE